VIDAERKRKFWCEQVSVSSTFYVRIFRMHVIFLVTFWLCQKIRTKNSYVKRWWNWHLQAAAAISWPLKSFSRKWQKRLRANQNGKKENLILFHNFRLTPSIRIILLLSCWIVYDIMLSEVQNSVYIFPWRTLSFFVHF